MRPLPDVFSAHVGAENVSPSPLAVRSSASPEQTYHDGVARGVGLGLTVALSAIAGFAAGAYVQSFFPLFGRTKSSSPAPSSTP